MKSILITGATGFIGSLLVKKIVDERIFNNIILPVRNVNKAIAMYGDIQKHTDCRIHFVESLLTELNRTMAALIPIDYIIHCASVTQSSEMILHPVETADSIVWGDKQCIGAGRAASC